MTGILIKVATSEDARTIAEVHVKAWQETYEGLLPDKMIASLSVQSRSESWYKILNKPASQKNTSVYLALEEPNHCIGFGACGMQRSDDFDRDIFDGEFLAIYVLKSAQRKGVGKNLMKKMTQNLIERGCNGAALWVLNENYTAREFYESLGGSALAQREELLDDNTVLREVAYGWEKLNQILD